MKKTLAMILTLALVICMMPTSAFAADPATLTAEPSGKTSALYTGSSITLPSYTVKYGGQDISKTDTAGGENGKYTLAWTDKDGKTVTAATGAGVYTATISYKDTNISEITITKTFNVTAVEFSKVVITYRGDTDRSQIGNFPTNDGDTFTPNNAQISVTQGGGGCSIQFISNPHI